MDGQNDALVSLVLHTNNPSTWNVEVDQESKAILDTYHPT